jgi:DNA-binding LytR/AlgR family response regulator
MKAAHPAECTLFSNAIDLLWAIEHGQRFDLVLLDILMPSMTGMDAAREIRRFDQDVRIVFLTSSTEFAVESYTVNAYYYVLKPIQKTQLFVLLDKVIDDTNNQTGSSFLIKSNQGLVRAYINKLEFAEIIGRTIFYHFTDGSITQAQGVLSELEGVLLPHSCFIKPHRSYIVNMSHIESLSQREIKMRTGNIVPMAKAHYRDIKSAYVSFTFSDLRQQL